jgi:hypothetical protein
MNNGNDSPKSSHEAGSAAFPCTADQDAGALAHEVGKYPGHCVGDPYDAPELKLQLFVTANFLCL